MALLRQDARMDTGRLSDGFDLTASLFRRKIKQNKKLVNQHSP